MVKKTRQLYLTVFILLLSIAFTGATGAAILVDETSGVDDTSSDQPIETVWIQRFSDDFDGTEIDAIKWNADLSTSGERWCSSTTTPHHTNSGNWIDVLNNPCNGFQTTSYGTITVNGGISSFSAGYNRAFPYIWSGEPSRQSPFPDTGDFILNVRMKYDSLRSHGNGFHILNWSNTEPVGDNPPGGQQYVFAVWGGSGGILAHSPAGSASISNSLAFHDYRLEYIDGKYSMFIDNVLNAGPVASNLRPNTIWIGNPVFTHWGAYEWTDFSIDSVTVTVPNLSPMAVTNGPYVANEGSAIIMDGSASYDPDTGDSIVSYEWDLDNDGIFDANGMTISNIWMDDYSGTVVLKVTDSYGVSNTATTIITVNNVAPIVDATVGTGAYLTVEEGGTVSFTGDFTDAGIIDSHTSEWDFGDGKNASGVLTPAHLYADFGIYTVTLKVTDDDGGIGTDAATVTVVDTMPPEINITGVSDGSFYNYNVTPIITITDKNLVSQSIILNGVSYTSGTVISEGGSYELVATGTDASGNSATQTVNFVIDMPPIAVINGPYVENEGSAIILDGSASHDPDTGDSIVSYEWDLDNDGIFDANGMTISNIWADDYSGTAVLKVTDSYGVSNTATTTVAVNNVAPTVEAITAPIDPVVVGTTIATSADFDDVGILDTHIAVWDWNDGTTDSGAVDESTGTVMGSHTYNASGIYTVKLTITDDDGGVASTEYRYVVVYSPDGEFVTGGGWIDSPAGAYTLDTSITGKANFGFVSIYKNGATVPTGATEFQLKLADFNFHSKDYEWLVIAGERAIYKGTGTVNGEGGYGFILTGIDGAANGDGADKFRIEVWDEATNAIIYDNLLDGSNDADLPAINGGNIVIHKN